MARRTARGAMAGAVVLTLALVTACTPDPGPTPTPTGFASEAEAFAAAEATYRAYIDAVNARREDPDSSPDPTDFLTGDALSAELASEQKFIDAGVSLTGDMGISQIIEIAATDVDAELGVCLDVTKTRVINTEGADVTPTDRPDLLGLTIGVVWSVDGPFIASTVASDDQC